MKIKIKYYEPIINYPDVQSRICKNIKENTWVGVVHERIIGAKTISNLPMDFNLDLIHHKTIEKQEKQNQLYSTL